MRKTMVVIALVCLGVIGAGVANAGSYFSSSVSPNKRVRPGTTLTATGHGAKRSTSYYCVVASYRNKQGAPSAPDTSTLKTVKSNAKGVVTCKVKYRPFSAKAGNATRHCPATAADKKAGYACGVAIADAATQGLKSASVAKFTPSK